MLGAIIGDLAGSVYEYDEFKSVKRNIDRRKEFLIIAILDAISEGRSYEASLKKYELKYYQDKPNTKANHFKYMFSPEFIKWCRGKSEGKSMGNGALMRVSPIGYLFNDLDTIYEETKKATIPSHDSPLAIVSAQSLNTLIYMGRREFSKESMKPAFYPFKKSLDKIRFTNRFDSSCLVFDNCLTAFFESNSFEDAIRKAISLGGDTDTIGAITGSIAEAYYGVPLELKNQALEKLPYDFVLKLEKGYQKVKKL